VARVQVHLPLGVSLPGMPELMQCEGVTIAEVLADCVAQQPRLAGRVFRPDGTLWVGVSVNGGDLPVGSTHEVTVDDGDVVRLVPAVGGC
jgi:molybdopterin converting factor small subunit